MEPLDAHAATSAWYATFAERDTAHASPLLSSWAAGVAGDAELLTRIDALEPSRRQPNLVLGAARFLGVPDAPWAQVRPWLLDRWDDVVAVVRTRRTQTNEAGRCAVLLPVLARLEGPLALLEVGASAGLCLYPDRYSYRYRTPDGEVALDPHDGPSPVVLPCAVDPADDVPRRLPEVAWRGGIDLEPLDVQDPDDVAWLSALVWPGQHERLARLRAAAALAAQDPPTLLRGDLNARLAEAASLAPRGAHLVVLHTAVLAYLGSHERQAFADGVRRLGATWVSNEGRTVVPGVERGVPPADVVRDRFVLAVDGEPRALTDPHGASWTAL